jgi:hypothetical protein
MCGISSALKQKTNSDNIYILCFMSYKADTSGKSVGVTFNICHSSTKTNAANLSSIFFATLTKFYHYIGDMRRRFLQKPPALNKNRNAISFWCLRRLLRKR